MKIFNKLFVLFCLLTFQFECVFAQKDTFSKSINIGNNDDFSGFETLQNQIKYKRLIFSGAISDYGVFNGKFEFKLFKYLNKTEGVRNLLLEMGPAKAFLVNQYINSNDSTVEKLLQSVCTVNAMKLYKSLKKLNVSLVDSLKIRAFGIDIERYKSLPLVRISQLLPDDSIPDRLRISVEAAEGAAKYIISKGLENYENELNGKTENSYYYNPGAFSIDETMNVFVSNFDTLKNDFKLWLGLKYADLETAIEWLKENKEWEKYHYSAFKYALHKEITVSRINQLVLKYPNEKYFGQFELCRVSKSILEKGCNFYNYSGIVNRMLLVNPMLKKDIFNLGIMYERDTDSEKDYFGKMDREGQDAMHSLLNKPLVSYFDSIPEGEARFFSLTKNNVKDSLVNSHFDIVLLNKNYPTNTISGDSTEADSAILKFRSKGKSSWLDDYDKARVYLGFQLYRTDINIGKMNAVLIANGYNGISSLNSMGVNLCFASADKSLVRLQFTQSKANLDYSNYRICLDWGSNFLYTKHIKWSVNSTLGFVRHKLTLSKGNLPSTFFPAYKPPIVIVNPAFFIGASSQLYLEYGPFYATADIGRIYDLGDSRWTINGSKTGTNGKLSNTSWGYGFGFGIALKMEWLDL